MSATRDDDIAYCIAIVKEHANELYLADLLLPNSYRNDIFVLHAFQAEVDNVILRTQEAAMGEIRLRWWAEVIEGKRDGEARGHPIARVVLDVIARHNLPRAAFLRKLEAHQFDFYNDPMGDRSTLEGYLGETHSCLFQLSGIIAGASDLKLLADASGHAGVATGIVWILKNMALHRNQQKIYVPSDLLEAAGLSAEQFLQNVPSAAHEQTVLALTDLANEHRLKFEDAVEKLPNDVASVFTQTAILQLYLNKARKNTVNSITKGIKLSQFSQQWVLLKY